MPLGEAVERTELHVDAGAGAILVSSTWRQGDFTVYNFEVEGTPNYFVRAQSSDSPAVLVHNSPRCFDALPAVKGLGGAKFESWLRQATGMSDAFVVQRSSRNSSPTWRRATTLPKTMELPTS